GDDQYLAGAAVAVRFDDHPAEARVDRQPGKLRASVGEPPSAAALAAVAVRRERAEFFEQADAVGNLPRIWRVDERKARDLTEIERFHLQDHRRQVGAQDLRVGELRARGEVFLAVQPTQMPSAVRPHRPLRWFADAWE